MPCNLDCGTPRPSLPHGCLHDDEHLIIFAANIHHHDVLFIRFRCTASSCACKSSKHARPLQPARTPCHRVCVHVTNGFLLLSFFPLFIHRHDGLPGLVLRSSRVPLCRVGGQTVAPERPRVEDTSTPRGARSQSRSRKAQ